MVSGDICFVFFCLKNTRLLQIMLIFIVLKSSRFSLFSYLNDRKSKVTISVYIFIVQKNDLSAKLGNSDFPDG